MEHLFQYIPIYAYVQLHILYICVVYICAIVVLLSGASVNSNGCIFMT